MQPSVHKVVFFFLQLTLFSVVICVTFFGQFLINSIYATLNFRLLPRSRRDIRALLGYFAAYSGNSIPTFRETCRSILDFLTLEDGASVVAGNWNRNCSACRSLIEAEMFISFSKGGCKEWQIRVLTVTSRSSPDPGLELWPVNIVLSNIYSVFWHYVDPCALWLICVIRTKEMHFLFKFVPINILRICFE